MCFLLYVYVFFFVLFVINIFFPIYFGSKFLIIIVSMQETHKIGKKRRKQIRNQEKSTDIHVSLLENDIN